MNPGAPVPLYPYLILIGDVVSSYLKVEREKEETEGELGGRSRKERCSLVRTRNAASFSSGKIAQLVGCSKGESK